MIHALVTSRLDYCNAVLYGLPASVRNTMQRLQNMCARMVTRTRRRDHITPVLIKLHWLPVRRRIEYKILSRTYRAIHRQAPQYLCDMLPLYQPFSCTAVPVDIDAGCTSFRNKDIRWPVLSESSRVAMEQFACQPQRPEQYCRISARPEDIFI